MKIITIKIKLSKKHRFKLKLLGFFGVFWCAYCHKFKARRKGRGSDGRKMKSLRCSTCTAALYRDHYKRRKELESLRLIKAI